MPTFDALTLMAVRGRGGVPPGGNVAVATTGLSLLVQASPHFARGPAAGISFLEKGLEDLRAGKDLASEFRLPVGRLCRAYIEERTFENLLDRPQVAPDRILVLERNFTDGLRLFVAEIDRRSALEPITTPEKIALLGSAPGNLQNRLNLMRGNLVFYLMLMALAREQYTEVKRLGYLTTVQASWEHLRKTVCPETRFLWPVDLTELEQALAPAEVNIYKVESLIGKGFSRLRTAVAASSAARVVPPPAWAVPAASRVPVTSPSAPRADVAAPDRPAAPVARGPTRPAVDPRPVADTPVLRMDRPASARPARPTLLPAAGGSSTARTADKAGQREAALAELRERARSLSHQKDWTNLARTARDALAIDPSDSEMLFALGYSLQRLRRFDEARPHLERAYSLDRRDPALLEALGDIALYQNRWDEAEAYFKEGLRQNAESLWFLFGYARALFELQRYAEAREQYKRLIELSRGQTFLSDRRLAEFLGRYADCLAALGEVNEAEKYYREAIRLNPGLRSMLEEKIARLRSAEVSAQSGRGGTTLGDLLRMTGQEERVKALVRPSGDLAAEGGDTGRVSETGLTGAEVVVEPAAAAPLPTEIDAGGVVARADEGAAPTVGDAGPAAPASADDPKTVLTPAAAPAAKPVSPLDQARAAVERGDLVEAVGLYARAFKVMPEQAAVILEELTKLREALRDRARLASSSSHVAECLAAYLEISDDPPIRRRLLDIYLNLTDSERALAVLRILARADEGVSFDISRQVAVLVERTHDDEKICEAYEICHRLAPQNIVVWHKLLVFYGRLKQWDRRNHILRLLLKKNPTDSVALESLARYLAYRGDQPNLRLVLLELKRVDNTRFRKIGIEVPDVKDPKHNVQEVIRRFIAEGEEASAIPAAATGGGPATARLGDVAGAELAAFGARMRAAQGAGGLSAGEVAEVTAVRDEPRVETPKEKEARLARLARLAQNALEKGQIETVRGCISGIIAADPNHPVLSNLFDTVWQKSVRAPASAVQREESFVYLRLAVQMHPNHHDVIGMFKLNLIQGIVLFNRHQLEIAIPSLEVALVIRPQDVEAQSYHTVARWRQATGRRDWLRERADAQAALSEDENRVLAAEQRIWVIDYLREHPEQNLSAITASDPEIYSLITDPTRKVFEDFAAARAAAGLPPIITEPEPVEPAPLEPAEPAPAEEETAVGGPAAPLKRGPGRPPLTPEQIKERRARVFAVLLPHLRAGEEICLADFKRLHPEEARIVVNPKFFGSFGYALTLARAELYPKT